MQRFRRWGRVCSSIHRLGRRRVARFVRAPQCLHRLWLLNDIVSRGRAQPAEWLLPVSRVVVLRRKQLSLVKQKKWKSGSQRPSRWRGMKVLKRCSIRSRGSRKKYHLRLDPKLGQGKFIILRIPCECVTCKSILYKPFNPGVSN